jgi:hypothetical protein
MLSARPWRREVAATSFSAACQGHQPRVSSLPAQEESAIRRRLSALRPASAGETPSVSIPRQSRALYDLEAAQRGLNPIAPLGLRRERAKHPLTLSPLSPLPSPQGSLCDNWIGAVIPSGARNLALSVFNAMRDSSSPAAPRNDMQTALSHRLLGRGKRGRGVGVRGPI